VSEFTQAPPSAVHTNSYVPAVRLSTTDSGSLTSKIRGLEPVG